MTRRYFSNFRPAWPVERQRETLTEYLPDASDGADYIDELPPKRRRKLAAADLVQRAEMLAPRGRKQVDDIATASLATLALSQIDLVGVLAAAEARGSVLIAVAEGIRLIPPYGAAAIKAAMDAFAKAIDRGRGNTKLGHEVSAQRRMDRAKAACDKIKERWSLPMKDHPTNVLLREAGVARATAIAHLGDRRKAIQAREVAERNRARRQADASED